MDFLINLTMESYFGKLLLIAVTTASITFQALTIYHRIKHLNNWRDWFVILVTPTGLVSIILMGNGFSFISQEWLAWEITVGASLILESGNHLFVKDIWYNLMQSLLAVTLGTAVLQEIIRQSLLIEIDFTAEKPEIATLRIQALMYRQLMVRHWLAILGIGTVFGLLFGSVAIWILAVDLTILWLISELFLRLHKEKDRSS